MGSALASLGFAADFKSIQSSPHGFAILRSQEKGREEEAVGMIAPAVRFIAIVFVLILTGSACAERPRPALPFWMPAGSEIDVGSLRPSKYGTGHLGFITAMPKTELVEALTRHFEQAGWHPRKEQYLNPGYITSFNVGWDYHGQWIGEWEDSEGNVITYHLWAARDSETVKAYGEFVTPAVVKRAKALLRKYRVGLPAR
jgi:hypothetical protein